MRFAFTTAVPVCPCSIWPTTATPKVIGTSDTQSVELGVKVRADVSGTVTALRFYKGTANTGLHTGTLWSSTGLKLATVIFTNETASGWQQAALATPVAVTGGTTYVVSYHAPVGRYAVDTGYFSSVSTTKAPVRALGAGIDGPDGLYSYAAGTIFPASTASSSNYWVDVVFIPSVP